MNEKPNPQKPNAAAPAPVEYVVANRRTLVHNGIAYRPGKTPPLGGANGLTPDDVRRLVADGVLFKSTDQQPVPVSTLEEPTFTTGEGPKVKRAIS